MNLLPQRTPTTFLQIWGVLWRLAAIATAVYVAWRVRFIIVIVLLSIILTFIVNPVVNRACRWRPRRIPRNSWRFLATFAVFITLITFAVGLVLWVWAPFQAQLNDLKQTIDHYQPAMKAHLSGLKAWYDRLPPSMHEALTGQPVEGLTGYVLALARGIVANTVNWVSRAWELILIPVLAFYFCLDSRSLKREMLFLVPYRRMRETLYILRHTSRIMQSYVVSQLVLCLVAGITVGVGLSLLRVPYPLVLGVLAGITRAVPIVGPVVSAIPITILTMTISMKLGLSVLFFFSVLHVVESKLLLPQLVGHSMKLHPAIILIVLLVGGEFFGILGMFLAAPVAAIFRMLLNLYVVEPEIRRRKGALGAGARNDTAGEPETILRKVS